MNAWSANGRAKPKIDQGSRSVSTFGTTDTLEAYRNCLATVAVLKACAHEYLYQRRKPEGVTARENSVQSCVAQNFSLLSGPVFEM